MPSDIRIYTVSLLRDTLIWFLVAIAICFAIAGLTGFVKIMARIAIWLTIIAIALGVSRFGIMVMKIMICGCC